MTPEQMLESVSIRPADKDDLHFYWEVNNEPSVRQQSISTDEIPWKDHVRWFTDSLQSKGRRLQVIEVDGKRSGVVRFDLGEDRGATLSIALSPQTRGMGIGTFSIRLATERLARAEPVDRVIALVRATNHASIKAFERAGYERVDQLVRDGVQLQRYIWEASA